MSDLKKPITWPDIPCDGEPIGLGWTNLYRDLRDARMVRWEKLAVAYEANPEDFHSAWCWIQSHPIFWCFGPNERHERSLAWERGTDEGMEFRVVKVDPETLRIEDDRDRNTLVQVWVEVFPASDDGRDGRLHDYRCDTGGDTYEVAVIAVAREIYENHGHDRVELKKRWKSA